MTHGLYGFRYKGKLYLTYCHADGYPAELGKTMAQFFLSHSLEDMAKFVESIKLVYQSSKPSEDDKYVCKKLGFYDDTVSTRCDDDYYCLLRKAQGEPEMLWDMWKHHYKPIMISNAKNRGHITCRHTYIIDIDAGTLIYEGFECSPITFEKPQSFQSIDDMLKCATDMAVAMSQRYGHDYA